MNEEIEYAEMLEIPVSTVNVVRKTRRRKKTQSISTTASQPQTPESATSQKSDLKDSVIAQVNDKLNTDETQPPVLAPVEEALPLEGKLNLDPVPDRIDTVRLYSANDVENFGNELFPEDYKLNENSENEGGRYALNYKKRPSKPLQIALKAEFAAACVLCGAIFLTNVFMPKSAINTFFRSLADAPVAEETDTRKYSDFTLSPIVSDMSDAELNLSATGILTFTDDCCVYPAADGDVLSVTQNADGTYTVNLSHSDTFTATISGLNYVYYAEGEAVKANVPIGYSAGEQEVQVMMYSSGALLNCFQITEENGLAWTTTTDNAVQNDTQI